MPIAQLQCMMLMLHNNMCYVITYTVIQDNVIIISIKLLYKVISIVMLYCDILTLSMLETRQDLSCTYLAHHELESILIIIIY